MKTVLDVGQFVCATITGRGHPGQILSLWRTGAFELVTSPPILNDLRRVLFYPHIRRRHRWTDEQIGLFLEMLNLGAVVTPGEPLAVGEVREDPTDDKILACAREANVDYIVASDEHLAKLRSFSGIPIIRPRHFLEILKAAGTQEV